MGISLLAPKTVATATSACIVFDVNPPWKYDPLNSWRVRFVSENPPRDLELQPAFTGSLIRALQENEVFPESNTFDERLEALISRYGFVGKVNVIISKTNPPAKRKKLKVCRYGNYN